MAPKSSVRKKKRSLSPDSLDELHDESSSSSSSSPSKPFTLSQHPKRFEMSQSLPEAKEIEKQRLSHYNPALKAKAITALSRLLLFKAFSGQAIDRRKCLDEAIPQEIKSDRISNAILEEAEMRLQDIWGLQIKGVPDFMASSLPGKYKDRFYVINHVCDQDGSHSMAIHNQEHTCEEKGLLMVVLALAFCKGTPIQTNAIMNANSSGEEDVSVYTARWINDDDLYRFLNNIDDMITEEPPRYNSRSKRQGLSFSPGMTSSRHARITNAIDVETLLEKFVAMDYLLKEKSFSLLGPSSQDESQRAATLSEEGFCYAMGPRAALEIGRRQLIYFCADILDEQPDPTMLEEINDESMENEQGGE